MNWYIDMGMDEKNTLLGVIPSTLTYDFSTFYLAFFDILSGIVSGSLFGMCSGPGVAGPQHPELAMWSSGPGMAGITRSPHSSAEKEDEDEEGERG